MSKYKITIKNCLLFVGAFIGGLFPVLSGYAAVNLFNGNLSGAPGQDLTIEGVLAIIVGVTCWISKTAIVIILCGIIVYAFLYFKSRGNPSELNTANQALKWGLVGALVIFAVYTIIRSVASALGVSDADLGTFLSFSLTCS